MYSKQKSSETSTQPSKGTLDQTENLEGEALPEEFINPLSATFGRGESSKSLLFMKGVSINKLSEMSTK